MLTKNQLYLPLLFYNICSKLGFIILEINCRDGTLNVQKCHFLRKPWTFILFCIFARGVFALLKLLETCLVHEKMSMTDMPMLIVLSYGYIAAGYVSMHGCIDYGHLTCSIFNTLHTGELKKSKKSSIKLHVKLL